MHSGGIYQKFQAESPFSGQMTDITESPQARLLGQPTCVSILRLLFSPCPVHRPVLATSNTAAGNQKHRNPKIIRPGEPWCGLKSLRGSDNFPSASHLSLLCAEGSHSHRELQDCVVWEDKALRHVHLLIRDLGNEPLRSRV